MVEKRNRDQISELVKNEVLRYDEFKNFHGITRNSIQQFLVEPFTVFVDPDDQETEPRDMWVVLKEMKDIKRGYFAVYDPFDDKWGIAEHFKDDAFIFVTGGYDSLQRALVNM